MKPTTTRRSASRPRGQGMTEYILIVSLIAIGAIGVITLFGDNVRALFGMSINGLAGETSVSKRTHASNEELEKKGLANAWQNNGAGD